MREAINLSANSPSAPNNPAAHFEELGRKARHACRHLATAKGAQKDQWLGDVAGALERRAEEILAANKKDLALAVEMGLSNSLLDRLQLTPERLRAAAASLREVAAL